MWEWCEVWVFDGDGWKEDQKVPLGRREAELFLLAPSYLRGSQTITEQGSGFEFVLVIQSRAALLVHDWLDSICITPLAQSYGGTSLEFVPLGAR